MLRSIAIRAHWLVFTLAIVIRDPLTNGIAIGEGILYRRLEDSPVASKWTDSADGLFRVRPDETELDLNNDGQPDLQFRHTHNPRPTRIDADAVALLRTAQRGIESTAQQLNQLHRDTSQFWATGVIDPINIPPLHAKLDDHLATMERHSRHFEYQGQHLFDGSMGKQATTQNTTIAPIRALGTTQPGSYPVRVTTPGEAATLVASATQSRLLEQDETLHVNSIPIDLHRGMSQPQVITRINDFTRMTGVIANSAGSKTVLYTQQFGAESTLEVISQYTGEGHSSGFEKTLNKDRGVDVEVTIGTNRYTGYGQTVVASSGDEAGLALQFKASQDSPTMTVPDAAGTIIVTDGSPRFDWGKPGQLVSIPLPSTNPMTLGLSHATGRFAPLTDIRVHRSSQPMETLAPLTSAIQELQDHATDISNFLALHAYPYGASSLTSMDGAEFLLDTDGSLLPAGITVGEQSEFLSGTQQLQESSVIMDREQSGFIGLRLPLDDGWHYGWLGLNVEADSSLRFNGVAWNSQPSQPIATAVVPEGGFTALMWILLALCTLELRRSRNAVALRPTNPRSMPSSSLRREIGQR